MTKLIGFGASSVQGVGDSQGGFFKRLEAKLAIAGKPHTCLNYGIGGNTTRDMIGRLDQVRPHLPCRALIMLGCNDLPRERDANPQIRVPIDEYAKNVATILQLFTGPDTLFISSFSASEEKTGIDPKTFAIYMGEALKAAASLELTTWNLYADSLSFGDKYWVPDGLHYNDAGHEMIVEHTASMIISLPPQK